MRKFMLFGSLMLALGLSACGPNPAGTGTGTGTDTGTGTGTGTGTSVGAGASVVSTKAAYIGFLNCVKAKYPVEAQASLDAAIAAVNAIPDATWAQASVALTANYQTVYATYLNACANIN